MNPFESKVLCFLLVMFLNGFLVSYIHKRRSLMYAAKRRITLRGKENAPNLDDFKLELFAYRYTAHFVALIVPVYVLLFMDKSIWYSLLLFILSLGWSFLISLGGKQSFSEVFQSIESHPMRQPIETRDIGNDAILNYTRLSFFRNAINKLIFDSSDYDYINEYFGTKKGKQPIFASGYSLEIDSVKYRILNVEVDLLNLFDDYELVGKSDGYRGRSIPYNIQVRIYLDDL